MEIRNDSVHVVIPPRAKRYLRRRLRRWTLDAAIRELAHSDSPELAPSTARNLSHGWGNENMSASEEFLQAIYRHACESPGPILECGSGLSTLVLGIAAHRSGQRVYALDDNREWVSVVRVALARYTIQSVAMCATGLRDYGEYKWYDPRHDQLPTDFSLVICDGPQGTTPGGRYGLMPVLGHHLRAGCVVLLDDADRSSEQQVLARWDDELHVSHEIIGAAKPFARLLMPAASGY